MRAAIGILTKKNIINHKLQATIYFDYVEAIAKVGGIPLLIPLINDPDYLRSALTRLDGLVIPGGIDPNPATYHAKIEPLCGMIDDELDQYELKAIEIASKERMPILGICRGLQILNIAFGGTLYQDLHYYPNYDESVIHDQEIYQIKSENAIHNVEIEKSTLLHDLYGNQLAVNSFHHQIIDQLAPRFKIAAKSSDGVIEAIESRDPHFILAVQWHPEKMIHAHPEQLKIFKSFVDICEIYQTLK